MTTTTSTANTNYYPLDLHYPHEKLWVNAAIFVQAATKGDLATVKQRINQSIHITDYAQALLGAAREGHLTVLEPLFAGCGATMAQKLIKHAASKRANKEFNLSRIYQDLIDAAASNGHLPIVKYLVEQRIDVSLIKAYTLNSSYIDDVALEKAAANGQLETVKYLLGHKNVWLRYLDSAGFLEHYILSAVSAGHLNVVEYFIGYMNIYMDEYKHKVTNIALIRAAYCGHLEVVKYLVRLGAIDNGNMGKALVKAAAHGHYDVVEYLLGIDNVCHDSRDNALIIAAYEELLPMVKLLGDHGANVGASSGAALIGALRVGNIEICKHLIERGADEYIEDAQLENVKNKLRSYRGEEWLMIMRHLRIAPLPGSTRAQVAPSKG
jgi:ankyrin repeat protein